MANTRVYDVQTCTLKQSNGSAFIGIKFLTAHFFFFFPRRENHKTHLVFVREGEGEGGGEESKVDE